MRWVRQSALRLIAAFDQERQIEPDWRADCGESDANHPAAQQVFMRPQARRGAELRGEVHSTAKAQSSD